MAKAVNITDPRPLLIESQFKLFVILHKFSVIKEVLPIKLDIKHIQFRANALAVELWMTVSDLK